MKYKVGDLVITTKKYDSMGNTLFPIGSVGRIVSASKNRVHPYEVQICENSWFYDEDMLVPIKTYEQGLNHAWELAQKINLYADEGGLTQAELSKIYDCGDTCKIMCLSYEEALAKLKAYEEEQEIKVGDIVEHTSNNGTVFVVTEIGKLIVGFGKYGEPHTFHFPNSLIKKTGKHIDIESILKEISEV